MPKGGIKMDKYKKLAEAFEMEELEERIEFHTCPVQGFITKFKALCDKAAGYISGNNGCGSGPLPS